MPRLPHVDVEAFHTARLAHGAESVKREIGRGADADGGGGGHGHVEVTDFVAVRGRQRANHLQQVSKRIS